MEWVAARVGVFILESACWWMGLIPDTAVCRVHGVPKLLLAHW